MYFYILYMLNIIAFLYVLECPSMMTDVYNCNLLKQIAHSCVFSEKNKNMNLLEAIGHQLCKLSGKQEYLIPYLILHKNKMYLTYFFS